MRFASTGESGQLPAEGMAGICIQDERSAFDHLEFCWPSRSLNEPTICGSHANKLARVSWRRDH
jgi:hypothetical protein